MEPKAEGVLKSGSIVFECPFCGQTLIVSSKDFMTGSIGIAITCSACKKEYGIQNPFDKKTSTAKSSDHAEYLKRRKAKNESK